MYLSGGSDGFDFQHNEDTAQHFSPLINNLRAGIATGVQITV